jgi:glucose/arabinose dehydrogenase
MKTQLKLFLLLVVLSLSLSGRVYSATTLPPGFSESWVAGGFLKPTTMAFAPDGRLFVCEQEGKLRVVRNGQLLSTPFLTVDVNFQAERGLAGVAIDPNYTTNGYVYIYYTAKTPTVHNRISRVQANPINRDVALTRNDGSLIEDVIFDLDDLSEAAIHNGGAMHFGLDGKLYVAVGENATPSNAQSLNTVKGKMLRLNPDGSIPADNPFYNQTTGNNRAVYALGFRNPFNFDIQPGTGRIFTNDVGASTWEEINEVLPGANYGWPTAEGPSNDARFVMPFFAYPHGNGDTSGCAITGGAFYNPANRTFPDEYTGNYFFTDYCNSWIRVLDTATKTATTFATGMPLYPVDLKVGPDGSLYYISHGMARFIASATRRARRRASHRTLRA